MEETPQPIPLEVAAPSWQPTKLIGKETVAQDTMMFVFEKPAGYSFVAGQHMDIDLINPTETDEKGTTRHFTLVSTPADADLRIMTRMRDSAFKRILGAMEVGTVVNIGPANGSFVLHEDVAKTAVFLAGGIGITAAYSMIKDSIERQLSHEIVLFYTNRRPEDTPLLAQIQQLREQSDSFLFVPTMTEMERSLEPWDGQTGYIDQPMLERYIPSPQKLATFYISGPPQMATAVQGLLTGWGVDSSNIRTEEYTGY